MKAALKLVAMSKVIRGYGRIAEARDWCASRALFSLMGISVGDDVRFIGMPVVRKVPGSIVRVGRGCTFRSNVSSNLIGLNRPCYIATLGPTAQLTIGNCCGFSGTSITALSSISIGDNVLCGANTTITDNDWHGIDPVLRRDPDSVAVKPVVIEDNVWLGLNVIVLKGVRIGENSVIGAGSVVHRDVPANVIAAGNPIKVLRPL